MMLPNDEIIDVEPIRTRVVVCPKCGQKNRISNESRVRFRCGSCKYQLNPDTPYSRAASIISGLKLGRFSRSKAFRASALALAGVAVLAGLAVIISKSQTDRPRLQPEESHPNDSPAPKPPSYVRPTTDPYGHAWPTLAGYIQGSKKSHTRGYSKVTVDNKENDTDVYVKLVALKPSDDKCVREFYIPARSQFTVSRVSAGLYEIRCLLLNSGHLSRTESFNLEETRTADGTNYTTLTLTLYKVPYGNMHSFSISPNEFYNLQSGEDEVPNLSFNSDPTGTAYFHVSRL